jgi:hypothetical protein
MCERAEENAHDAPRSLAARKLQGMDWLLRLPDGAVRGSTVGDAAEYSRLQGLTAPLTEGREKNS